MLLDSPVVDVMRKKAAEKGVAIILPIFEREDTRYFNSAVVIDADGSVKGTYRKLHVPDIPLWEEKFYFSTGDQRLLRVRNDVWENRSPDFVG